MTTNPFKQPESAAEEIGHRTRVLRNQAERAREDAANLRRQADELDGDADRFETIASEYDRLGA